MFIQQARRKSTSTASKFKNIFSLIECCAGYQVIYRRIFIKGL